MLKMNELVKQSSTPKSTILYYIKEGLLPEPQKPKANLHLYDDSMVEKIEFIQYLQKNFHSSIAELKAIFSNENFDINSPYESILNLLHVLMGADFTEVFTASELCKEFDIPPKKLQKFIDDGLLHVRDGKFTQSEKQMLKIIINSNKNELTLIKKYVQLSKQMASLEVDLGLNSNKNRDLKHLFDIMLILKPYIFNMQTLHTYQKEKK